MVTLSWPTLNVHLSVYFINFMLVLFVEQLASEVDNTSGCYFVPAFSGLFCPYWQDDARG